MSAAVKELISRAYTVSFTNSVTIHVPADVPEDEVEEWARDSIRVDDRRADVDTIDGIDDVHVERDEENDVYEVGDEE